MTDHDTKNHVIVQSERIGGKVNMVIGPFTVQKAKEMCEVMRAEEQQERPMLFFYNVLRLFRPLEGDE